MKKQTRSDKKYHIFTQKICFGPLFYENSHYPRVKSDFEGLLSRDDLDETAQAIIAQLQDLIAKQGLHSRQ